MNASDAVWRWLADKPPALGLLSLACVVAAEEFADVLKALRKRHGLGRGIPRGKVVDEWLRLYRRHSDVWDVVSQVIWPREANAPTATEEGRGWRQIIREAQSDPDEFKRALTSEIEENGIEPLQEMIGDVWAGFRAGMTQLIEWAPMGPQLTSEEDEQIDAMLPRLEFQFYFRVCGPCWIEYGVFPQELMLEARRGDIDAIDKLVRLDKLAMFDHRIRDHIVDAAYHERRGRFNRICNAVKGRPSGAMTRKRVKYAMAGFIHLMADQMHKPLEEPEIRTLFDAVAMLRGQQRDDDLPATPDSFYKAIIRSRKVRRFGSISDKG